MPRRPVPLERLYPAVAGSSLADLTVAANGVGGLIQHGGEAKDPFPFRLELEQPLLDLRAEIDARCDLKGDRLCVEVDVLELGLGGLDDALVGGETLLELRLGRVLADVVDVRDLRCLEDSAFGELDEPEAFAALDDHIELSILELLEHLDDTGASSDLTQSVVVLENEAELLAVLEALADQLPIAGLEHVQGGLLSGQKHEVERKESELAHN
jgi:hypothetical protein